MSTNYCTHALSQDGDRSLAGRWDGEVCLRDRSGTAIWNLPLKHPAAAALFCGEPSLFLVGTWGGTLAGFVDRGQEWQHELTGAVSALACSEDGTLAAGSWTGQVRILRREGDICGSAGLHDAVSALAMDPRGTTVYAALADRTLIALEPDGSERWRRVLPARVRLLGTSNYEVLLVSEDGTLLWLHADGSEVRRATAEGLSRVAASPDGSTLAWVDGARSLHFWQPVLDRRWDVALSEDTDALAVASHGDQHFCVAVLASGALLVFDRYTVCRRREEPLPGPAADLRLSRTGARASLLLKDGELLVQELDLVRAWLAPAHVRHRLSAGSYVVGRVGTVTIELTNEGSRDARDVQITLSGEHILPSEPEVVRALSPGTRGVRVRLALEPLKAGEVPITITLRYLDEGGVPRHETFQEFLIVTPMAQGDRGP